MQPPQSLEEFEARVAAYERRTMRRTLFTILGLLIAGAAILLVLYWEIDNTRRELQALKDAREAAAEELTRARGELQAVLEAIEAHKAEITIAKMRVDSALAADPATRAAAVDEAFAELRAAAATPQIQQMALPPMPLPQMPQPQMPLPPLQPTPPDGTDTGTDDTGRRPLPESDPQNTDIAVQPQSGPTFTPLRITDDEMRRAVIRWPQVDAALGAALAIRDGSVDMPKDRAAARARLRTATDPTKGFFTSLGFVGEVYRQLPRHGGMRLVSDNVAADEVLRTLPTRPSAPHPGDAIIIQRERAALYLGPVGRHPHVALELTARGVVAVAIDVSDPASTAHAGLSSECLADLERNRRRR